MTGLELTEPALAPEQRAVAPQQGSTAPARTQNAQAIRLRLEGISLAFGGIRALKEVSFDIRDGEIRAVIGPNGAGKSSLVNVISGLYRADSGVIVHGGESFAHVPPTRLPGLGVARTFQNLALFPGLTVAQNIASGLVFRRQHGLFVQLLSLPAARRESRETEVKLRAIADLLGLSDQLDRLVSTLPYGLQKQVELARALVAGPRLLLLDEPMAGLTGAEKTAMAGQIRAVRDRLGLSVILIEHDIGVVMGLSDRIVVLDHGEVIADGSPDQVRRDPEVIRAYLGQEAAGDAIPDTSGAEAA